MLVLVLVRGDMDDGKASGCVAAYMTTLASACGPLGVGRSTVFAPMAPAGMA